MKQLRLVKVGKQHDLVVGSAVIPVIEYVGVQYNSKGNPDYTADGLVYQNVTSFHVPSLHTSFQSLDGALVGWLTTKHLGSESSNVTLAIGRILNLDHQERTPLVKETENSKATNLDTLKVFEAKLKEHYTYLTGKHYNMSEFIDQLQDAGDFLISSDIFKVPKDANFITKLAANVVMQAGYRPETHKLNSVPLEDLIGLLSDSIYVFVEDVSSKL